jgi:AcrR family transcriptional regulator
MGKISQQKQVFAEQLIREQVYSAVLQVLSEYGLEKLTVQRVAAAAHLATGTLYNYFKDKDALLVYAAVRLFEQIRQQQADAISTVLSPAKKLQAFLETTFMFFNKNIAFFRFLDQAQVYCKIDMAIKHDHVNQEIRMLSGIIEDGIKAGVFKAIDAEKTAIFFHRAFVGTLCVNPELGDFDPCKEAKSLVKMFTAFLSE